MRGVEVQTIRIGRHTVTAGDRLRVAPSSPRRRDGFVGTFRSARVEGDTLIEITVAGAPTGRPRALRTFRPERISWMRQERAAS